ncbi:MAG: hypothetical protein ABIA67_01835, partial [Candidatus Margulisiibacteriota bacterium]
PNGDCRKRKKNINSDQPRDMFVADAARNEVEGLKIAGALECGITELGRYFGDLEGFAQIYRASRPEWKYFSWMRMDAPLSTYEMLAELEGKPVERFLYEAGVRFGWQLRRLHEEKMTLLSPFRNGTAKDEAEFSSLHSANVDPFGTIVDFEGKMRFDEAEDAFGRQGGVVPKEIKDQPFSFFCRASDLLRFVGGRTNQKFGPETHLFRRLARDTGAPDNFFRVVAGVFEGYYKMDDKAARSEFRSELQKLVGEIDDAKRTFFSFRQMLRVLTEIEKGRPF